ncbi:MAG: LysM domain-containing protein [Acidimicrobiia bacterium]|nr:LysM domain-containing protein [Acidimicrobiia bacterium]
MKGKAATVPVVLVMATTALVLALHQLGNVTGLSIDWSNPAGWADTATAEAMVGGCARQLGLFIGYWVLLTVVVSVLSHGPRRPRWVELITVPAVRRMVDRALAATMALSIVTTSLPAALAEPPPPIVSEAHTDGIPVPHITMVDVDAPKPDKHDAGSDTVSVPIRIPTPSLGDATARIAQTGSHVVQRGENLWTIAAMHLATELGDEPDGRSVGEYWRLVVAANRLTLRSGDPNLIYPGEVLSLPDIPGSP